MFDIENPLEKSDLDLLTKAVLHRQNTPEDARNLILMAAQLGAMAAAEDTAPSDPEQALAALDSKSRKLRTALREQNARDRAKIERSTGVSIPRARVI